jgi:type II secretory pathway pseudopilin PulG
MRQARGRKTSIFGMTLIEMVMAVTIFTVFGASFSSAWSASRKQIGYVINRSRLLRESMTARTWLSVDLSSATLLNTDTSNYFSVTRTDGDTINYTLVKTGSMYYGKLERYDNNLLSTMTVAGHVSQFSAGPVADNTNQFVINYEFSGSTFAATTNPSIDLCMYWNKITQIKQW